AIAPHSAGGIGAVWRHGLQNGFGHRSLVLEQDFSGLDREHLHEHEVLNASLSLHPFVSAEDFASDEVARSNLLTPLCHLCRVERIRLLRADLLHELTLTLDTHDTDMSRVDQIGRASCRERV